MEKVYSKPITNAITAYLTENKWHFSFDEKRGQFKFARSLNSKIQNINYFIDVKEDRYIVYAISPIGADADESKMMASMAEFICRANCAIPQGNLELDFIDGEIRFKDSVNCKGMTPTNEIVSSSIHFPIVVFEQYGAGILDIIFSNTTARDAIEQCESEPQTYFMSHLCQLASKLEMMEAEANELLRKIKEALSIEADGTSADAEKEPLQIKTDLFVTEGDDA